MNDLVKYLVESILLTEGVSKLVVVYGGRFQPFHTGHFGNYMYLVNKFGKDSVYIATSDSKDSGTSPFGFKEKKAIMTQMFGVPSNRIVQVKNAYKPVEILHSFNPETTALVVAVGEKDSMRLSGKYFKPYKDTKGMQGYEDKGYVFSVPMQAGGLSGTETRRLLSTGTDAQKRNAFLKIYPKFDEKIFKLITLTLKKIKTESKRGRTIDEILREVTSSDMRRPINEGLKELEIEKSRLFSKALKAFPNSAIQLKIRVELKKVMDKIDRLKKESITESLIQEGGAYGHMSHPFDIQMNLTFGDLKRIVKQALTGKLQLTTEKVDGQAIAVSWVNGRLVAARNKSHLKNKGKDAMDFQSVATKFAGRGAISEAFTYAMKDLESAISGLSDGQKKKIFKNGKCFMNCEIVYPASANVIPYGQAVLLFHGTMEYDEGGTAIGANPDSASQLAKMIEKINANVQSKFSIKGPTIQTLPVNQDLKSNQSKYLSMITSLQSEFGLTDKDGVAEYHQAWWRNFIDSDKISSRIDEQEKIGLIRRWAFDDKSFSLSNLSDSKVKEWADKIEKQSKDKIAKENIRKFEAIFLGVGADVLSFMKSVLTVDPEGARQQMVSSLQTTINSIRSTGTADNIAKLELELSRLQSIGGFDKIVPTEGIAFSYKGHTYKLTGAFASVNQIMGIMKYDR